MSRKNGDELSSREAPLCNRRELRASHWCLTSLAPSLRPWAQTAYREHNHRSMTNERADRTDLNLKSRVTAIVAMRCVCVAPHLARGDGLEIAARATHRIRRDSVRMQQQTKIITAS